MATFLRSCQKETPDEIQGKVTGQIPKWLEGSLMRNGAGMFRVGDTSYNHLFDGLGIIQKYTIRNGSVTYSNKFLRSNRYETNMAANRIVMSEVGTVGYPDPCKTLWERFTTRFSPSYSDNCNVTFTPYNDELYAVTETNFIWKVDPKTLDTKEQVDITKFVAVNRATSHTHVEKDGTVWNVGSSFSRKSYYNIIKFPPPKNEGGKTLSSFDQAEIVATIPSRWSLHPAYFHSFALSENYIIFIEQPLVMSLPSYMANVIYQRPFAEHIQWYGDQKTLFYVINKKTGEVLKQKYQSDEPFSFFHTINAYEEDSHIVLDVCTFQDIDTIKSFYLKHIQEMIDANDVAGLLSKPWRFILPLNPKEGSNENLVTLKNATCTAIREKDGTITCSHDVIDNAPCELGVINYSEYNGKKYRYMYALGVDKIIKTDWENKSNILSWHDDGYDLMSPIFVPAPNAKKEDEGIIMFALLGKDKRPNDCVLVILDAQNFKELARATFTTNDEVPVGFHSIFLSKEFKNLRF